MYDRKLLFLRSAPRIAAWGALSALKVEGFHKVPGFPFPIYLQPAFRSVGSLALYALGTRYELGLHQLPELLRRGDVVFDCGASQGGYALYSSHLVGPTGRVFAVEPQPYAARAIRISAALNGFEHLRVEEAAVCDEEGTMPFFENRKAVSSGLVDYYGVAEGRRVPVRTIDSLALQHALDRLDLIKLDVEGVEHKVLLGAETSIARFRPLVVFESWAVDDPNYVGVWETLTSWGYRVFDLVGRNRLQELERLTPSYNLLAAPPERLERLEGFIGAPVVADWGDQEAEAVTAA